MRPERIELSGFGSFRQPTVIDLDDVDAFALVGPTGAGKSTVIDALCFALYGSVPRYQDQRLVGAAVSVGANEARVRVTFTLERRRFVVARVVRRQRDGRATTKEARLEELLPDGVTRSVAGTAKDVTAAVEQLLGLPFAHFTRCVVLPQGAFARFLHDTPADRQDLLVRLLGLDVYERLGQQARLVAKAAQAEAAADERRLSSLQHATPQARAAAVHRRDGLRQVVGAVEEAAAQVAALEQTAHEATANAQRHERLAIGLSRVVVPPAARALAQRRTAAEGAVEQAETAVKDAAAAAVTAHERIDALGPIGPLHAAQRAHAERAVARAQRAASADDLAAAGIAAEQAELARGQAEAAEADATARVTEAERRHAAHALAAGLVPGEPCPVCRQSVDALFVAAEPPPELDAVREAARAAACATRAARQRLEQASATRAGAAARVEAATARCAALDAELAAHPDPCAVEASLAEHEAARRGLVAAGHAEQEARHRLDAARRERAGVDRDSQRLLAALHASRDPLAELAPPVPGDDVAAGWGRLAAWAAERRPIEQAAAGEARAEAVALVGQRDARLQALVALAAAAGADVDRVGSIGALQSAVVRAEAAAEHAVARIEDAQAEADELRRRVAATLERAEVAGELARLLTSAGFERWLVAGALDALVTGASATLGELSGGQYSLCVDPAGDLAVVDHRNADERRGVRSLSGGETFQAALALALTLSERIAALAGGGRARLEAIFLDEGFGSLDAESLDTVAATIEALAGEGRMVGVVTHVGALAERIPVRLVVSRGATTSSVVREVA